MIRTENNFFEQRRIVVGDIDIFEMEKIYNREGGISGYSGKATYVLRKDADEVLNLNIKLDAGKLPNGGGVATRVIFVCRPLKYAKSVELGNRPNLFKDGMFSYAKGLVVEAMSRGKIVNDFKYLKV